MIGRYRPLKPNWGHYVQEKKHGALWGGELAANEITHYLKPDTYTIYTNGRIEKLLVDCRLHPDPTGEVEILRIFWRENTAELMRPPQLVPLPLIYADLIAMANGRTTEVAKKICNEYLFKNAP